MLSHATTPVDSARLDYWAHYFRDLADRMELRDWTITIQSRPADDDACAQVTCIYGRKIATIKLADDFDSYAPEKQRQTAVHELLHAHLDHPQRVIDQANEVRNRNMISLLSLNHRMALEHAVDAISDIIAPFMPLPEGPARKRKKGKKKRGRV